MYYSTNSLSCIDKLPPSTICHSRGFSAFSAGGPGIPCHPAGISAVMRLERRQQFRVPHKCPFHVLLADPPSPLAPRPYCISTSCQEAASPYSSCGSFPGRSEQQGNRNPLHTLEDLSWSKSGISTQLQGHLLKFSEGSSFLFEKILF